MKNTIIFVVTVIVLGAVGFSAWGYINERELEKATSETIDEENENDNQIEGASVVSPGTYVIDPERSKFEWAGKKPFIEGYTNSGTIEISEGNITVSETDASGTFTLDMNSLHVGLTAKKQGQEGALEGHLKGERWFDVDNYPTAIFVITEVEPTTNSDTTFKYNVTGDLTMKGINHEISFPAAIYMASDGTVRAEAKTEIDRTRWGITSGSGSFFENLGDNLIADEVAISFSVVATLQE